MSDIDAPKMIDSIDDAIIESDFEPSQGLTDQLNDYRSYISTHYPSRTPDNYLPPYIVDAIWPMDSADLGLNDELVWAVDDGVMVIVPFASGRAPGDLVKLQWGGSTVMVERIAQAMRNDPVTLNVSSDDVPEGLHGLAYTLERGGQVYARSPSVKVLVRYGQPGVAPAPMPAPATGGSAGSGQAPGGGSSGPSNSGSQPGTSTAASGNSPRPAANPFIGTPKPAAPKPSLPPSGAVTQADLANGVSVTIAGYPNMRQGDVITLNWGDQTVDYTVQAGDIGKPVTINVGRATLLAAASQDQVSVSYYITTAPAWKSQVSDALNVPVQLSTVDYPPPSVVDPKAPEKNYTVSSLDLEAIKGLDVIVKVDTVRGFKQGDTVKLYWEVTDAAGRTSATVVGSEDVVVIGRTLRYTLRQEEVAKYGQGRVCVYYEVYSGKSVNASRPSFVQVHGSQSGQAGGSQSSSSPASPTPLAAPTAPGKVTAHDAKKAVVVTVPPYVNMRANDFVYLYWGDEVVGYKVRAEDVGKPLSITVPAATISAAGASNRLPVAYYIEDEVGNESEWSYETDVIVELKKDSYPAPRIVDPRDPDNNEVVSAIDLDRIDGADLVIKVDTPAPFAVNDTVTLYWVITSEAGNSTTLPLPAQVVSTVDRTLRFTVPYGTVANAGKGHAHAYYEVASNGTTQRSPSAFVDIDGALDELPAPLLSEASEGRLEADSARASVLVPADAGLVAGDEVQVQWKGMAADGTPLVKLSPWRTVTAKGAGKGVVFRFKATDCVAPLDGGEAAFSYTVKRKSGVVEKSATSTVEIGNRAKTLPAPTLDPAETDHVVDPSLADFKLGADVVIPPNSNISTAYKLTMVWTTSEGGYYEDSQQVAAGSDPSPFGIDPAQFKSAAGKPMDVVVYYVIERDGFPKQVSEDLTFRVAEPHMLATPLAVNQGTMVFDWVCVDLKGWFAPERINHAYQGPSDETRAQSRKATGGSPPYKYSSDNPTVAQVDSEGRVKVLRSGTARIYIIDGSNQTVSYPVRATNIFLMRLGEISDTSHTGAVAWQRKHGYSPCLPAHVRGCQAGWGRHLLLRFKGLKNCWLGSVQRGYAVGLHNNGNMFYATTYQHYPEMVGVAGIQSL